MKPSALTLRSVGQEAALEGRMRPGRADRQIVSPACGRERQPAVAAEARKHSRSRAALRASAPASNQAKKPRAAGAGWPAARMQPERLAADRSCADWRRGRADR